MIDGGTYLVISWSHDGDEAVQFWHELDVDRWETRRVERFADGTMLRTDERDEELDVSLSTEVIPSVKFINDQPEFDARTIGAAEFEEAWASAGGSGDGHLADRT
jgi:hypothetical protein